MFLCFVSDDGKSLSESAVYKAALQDPDFVFDGSSVRLSTQGVLSILQRQGVAAPTEEELVERCLAEVRTSLFHPLSAEGSRIVEKSQFVRCLQDASRPYHDPGVVVAALQSQDFCFAKTQVRLSLPGLCKELKSSSLFWRAWSPFLENPTVETPENQRHRAKLLAYYLQVMLFSPYEFGAKKRSDEDSFERHAFRQAKALLPPLFVVLRCPRLSSLVPLLSENPKTRKVAAYAHGPEPERLVRRLTQNCVHAQHVVANFEWMNRNKDSGEHPSFLPPSGYFTAPKSPYPWDNLRHNIKLYPYGKVYLEMNSATHKYQISYHEEVSPLRNRLLANVLHLRIFMRCRAFRNKDPSFPLPGLPGKPLQEHEASWSAEAHHFDVMSACYYVHTGNLEQAGFNCVWKVTIACHTFFLRMRAKHPDPASFSDRQVLTAYFGPNLGFFPRLERVFDVLRFYHLPPKFAGMVVDYLLPWIEAPRLIAQFSKTLAASS